MIVQLKVVYLSIVLGVSMFNTNQTVGQQPPLIPAELTQKALKNPIKVKYTNYRGETAIRTIVPIFLFWQHGISPGRAMACESMGL